MSIVRHKDKKSGSIIVYESTSHYDPVTKQSRPKRKYLGIEDPVTGELIPSSGKRGRRKVIANGDAPVEKKTETETETETEAKAKIEPDYKLLLQNTEQTLLEKERIIQQLEADNTRLQSGLEQLKTMITELLNTDSHGLA